MEETNLGRLVAEIVLDTASMEENVRNVIDMISEIEQSVRSADADIDLGDANANVNINNTHAIQNIQAVINEIEHTEIVAQNEISVNIDNTQAIQNIQEALNAIRQAENTATNQQAEIHVNTLDAIHNLNDVADSSDDAAESFENTEEAAANLEAALNTAGHAAETLETIFPGLGSGLSDMVSIAGESIELLASGASKGLVYANAIVGLISIVIGWIVSAIDEYNQAQEEAAQAQEEARQAAVQAAEEYKDNVEQLKSLASEYGNLKSKLDAANMSHIDEIDIKNQLMSIQQQLIDQYGDEAKTIDLVTGSIDEQRKAIEELSKAEDEKYVAEYYSDYKNAQENLAQKQTVEIATVYTLPNSSKKYDSGQEALKELLESEGGYHSDSRSGDNQNFVKTISIDIENGNAEEKLTDLQNKLKKLHDDKIIDFETYDNNRKMISDAFKVFDEEKIAGDKSVIEQFEAAQNRLKDVGNETEKINNTIGDSITLIQGYKDSLSELSSVYKTVAESGKLDTDTLNSLIEKYPTLSEYIAETGDLTLRNGEVISSVMRMKNIEITQQLEKEKEALELQKKTLNYTGTAENIAQHEAIADRIEEINAQLKVYEENLSEIEKLSKQVADTWSDTSEELNILASAYQTLADGEKLDIDTTLELIDKYPELASSMAKTGELGEEQADIFKTLFEAKKNDCIITQQSALDNIKATEAETKFIIASLQTQIAMYGFKLEYLNEIAGKTAEVARLEAEAEKYEAKIKALQNLNIDDYGSSSSGSDRNEALQEELKLLDHKKAIGQLTAQQELNWLNRINQTYSMNTDEKMDMEKRLYNVKKQLQEEAEQAAENALNAEYERIENLKSLGKLNTRQELAQLEQIRKKYKLNAEQAMDLEIKLYNLKKELKQEETDRLDTLADAVTEALKNKYKEQQEAEEKLIDESIENWQKWEEKTTDSIQSEIDALDKLSETQESENARQEYEQKRQATELQLAYEKDDYNRKQLEKELNRLDKEEAQRLLEEEIKTRKEELQAQMESVQKTSSAAQEKLNAEKEAISKNYEELTREFALRAEAEKVILNNTQKETVDLIKSYAPEYNVAGQTLGEQLYEGMKSKVDNIFSYIAQIESYVDRYQKQMAATANAATDDFWASRTAYEKELASMSVESSTAARNVTVQQTVNFNQPVESPVETRRQLDRTSQALAQQIASGT